MLEKRFIGVKECAEYLGIARATLYQWVNMKKIPYYKIGSFVKFDLKNLETWIQRRKVKTHPIWDEISR